jgi:hypothetical protein
VQGKEFKQLIQSKTTIAVKKGVAVNRVPCTVSLLTSTPMLHETKPLIAQKPVISQQRAVASSTGTKQQKNSEFWCSDQGLWKKRGFKFSLLYYVNSDIEEAKAKAERSGEQEAL